MGLENPQGGQIKREQPYDTGPGLAPPSYGQQYGPGPAVSPFGFQPRVIRAQEGWGLGLGVGGMLLGMAGMMLGILGATLEYMVCGWIGGACCILSIVIGAVLTAKGQKIGIGVLAMGMMGLMMMLMMVGIFWWTSQV
jgi:hypothetical protein